MIIAAIITHIAINPLHPRNSGAQMPYLLAFLANAHRFGAAVSAPPKGAAATTAPTPTTTPNKRCRPLGAHYFCGVGYAVRLAPILAFSNHLILLAFLPIAHRFGAAVSAPPKGAAATAAPTPTTTP